MIMNLPLRKRRPSEQCNIFTLEIFPFLGNNCRKTGNTRNGTEVVNPCIEKSFLIGP